MGGSPAIAAPSTSEPSTWQQPPEPIASQLDVPLHPATYISPDNQWMVQAERPYLTPLMDLTEPVVQIAGITLNPNTRGPAKEYALRSLSLQNIGDGPRSGAGFKPVTLPDDARIRNLTWSLDSRYLAFTLTQPQGLELWVLYLETGVAHQLTGPILNGTYGRPCDWLPGDAGLVCKVVPADQGPPPEPPLVPPGPRIEENLGREAPARTYTNLLKSRHDETLFEYYLTSVLEHVSLEGDRTPITSPLLIDEAIVSPDGQAIILDTIQRPFSYQVRASRFPKRIDVIDLNGDLIYPVAQLPLADDIPTAAGSVRAGRRRVSWRSDRPSTLYWVEALDDGGARRQVPYRDALYQLDLVDLVQGKSGLQAETNSPEELPQPELLWKTEFRFSSVLWGHERLAIAYEYWHNTRQLRTWKLEPGHPDHPPRLLNERNSNDAYNHPGSPITAPGPYGWYTLLLAESPQTSLDEIETSAAEAQPGADRSAANSLLLDGRGASPDGVFPFLDRWTVETGETERLWQSQSPYYERIVRILAPNAHQFITHRQSLTTPPNFWLHHSANETVSPSMMPLTAMSDPLPWYADMHREVVSYQRADGVDLSGTLYLPPGYQVGSDDPLPTLLWVYPQEYKSRETASQRTQSDNVFRRPRSTSPLFLLNQGYAVLMNPRMPIIGEGEEEPNDTYIDQLISSAEAAVDYLAERGVGDRDRMAIGGHSYGAFTAANLLAHTDLFCAGIARSGAYNRTLTPFGFQGEQRNFWDAEETYMTMSPFTHANSISAPLLLIHGAEDRNSGTYPMQSERLYEALKGLGGTVRWVELPLEGHGYQSREAVGHVLWEMVNWLDHCMPATIDD